MAYDDLGEVADGHAVQSAYLEASGRRTQKCTQTRPAALLRTGYGGTADTIDAADLLLNDTRVPLWMKQQYMTAGAVQVQTLSPRHGLRHKYPRHAVTSVEGQLHFRQHIRFLNHCDADNLQETQSHFPPMELMRLFYKVAYAVFPRNAITRFNGASPTTAESKLRYCRIHFSGDLASLQSAFISPLVLVGVRLQ